MADYILREDAIEAHCMNCQYIDQEDDKSACWCMEKDRLIQIPAAYVRPVKKGRWIRRSDDSCTATCSVCGKENNYAFCIMSLDEQSLVQQDMFCPNCGADMRGRTLDG